MFPAWRRLSLTTADQSRAYLYPLTQFISERNTDFGSDITLSGAVTSFRLKVVSSRIAAGGSGLVAASTIPLAEDIFSKNQTLSILDSDHCVSACDHRLRWLGDSINAQGRILGVSTMLGSDITKRRNMGSLGKLQNHVKEYRQYNESLWEPVDQGASKAQQWTGSSDTKDAIIALYCQVKLNCMSLIPLDNECLGISLDILGATMYGPLLRPKYSSSL